MTLNIQCILYTRLPAVKTHRFQRLHAIPKIQYCQTIARNNMVEKNNTI